MAEFFVTHQLGIMIFFLMFFGGSEILKLWWNTKLQHIISLVGILGLLSMLIWNVSMMDDLFVQLYQNLGTTFGEIFRRLGRT